MRPTGSYLTVAQAQLGLGMLAKIHPKHFFPVYERQPLPSVFQAFLLMLSTLGIGFQIRSSAGDGVLNSGK